MNNDLSVITHIKKFLTYIITITEKSPVKFRYSFVTKMHNLGKGIIENLYYANVIELGNYKNYCDKKSFSPSFSYLILKIDSKKQ